MYGRYSESLGDYAREEAERQRVSEKIRRREERREAEEIYGKKRSVWLCPFSKVRN